MSEGFNDPNEMPSVGSPHEWCWAGGEWRRLGCHPRTVEPGRLFADYRDAAPLIPRSEWVDCAFDHLVYAITDQDGQGSCNACAAVKTLETIREAAGLPRVSLSVGCLYGQINGGRDAGSMMGDALRALVDVGTVKTTTIGTMEWQRNKWPGDWQEEAKDYRIAEAWDCPTFDAMASAILRGFFVDYGILIGGRFTPDGEGVIPPYDGRQTGGHAMCGCGLRKIGSIWHILTVNSWSAGWGRSGRCFVPESYFKNATWTDGWAVRVSTYPDFTASARGQRYAETG